MNPLPRPRAALPGVVLLLVGCAGPSARLPGPPPPPPPLQLQAADALQLAADCRITSGQVVRVDYAVRTDGRVETPRADGGSECLDDGLERWVASFRYAPVAATVAATLEWMPVLPRHAAD
jgi:hypothetical protein